MADYQMTYKYRVIKQYDKYYIERTNNGKFRELEDLKEYLMACKPYNTFEEAKKIVDSQVNYEIIEARRANAKLEVVYER